MPTDYANAAYWTDRLRTEGSGPGFDWLLAGDDVGFKSFIQSTLDQVSSSLSPPSTEPTSPLRILHIGPGSSTLSLWMRGLVEDPRDVVHVDFAESAKELGERWERERWPDAGQSGGGGGGTQGGSQGSGDAGAGGVRKIGDGNETSPSSSSGPVRRMRWLTGDMTRWADVERLPAKVAEADISDGRWRLDAGANGTDNTHGGDGDTDQPPSDSHLTVSSTSSSPPKFSLLVDKGTLDAITCGSDLSVLESASGPDTDGLAQRILALYPSPTPSSPAASPSSTTTLNDPLLGTPVYASLKVALNLAAITRPGGAWVMLSYSGTRFDLFMRKWRPQPASRAEAGGGGRKVERPKNLEELASRLWHLEVRRELVAEQRIGEQEAMAQAESRPVHRPVVFHWLYLLRRTEVDF